MGAGSSSSFGLSTSDANKMLTQIFTQTDMDSYLTMVNPAACAKFDFSSLTPGMRKDIQAVGGILRAPGQNAQNVEICFQQAKGYSKAFEIFAALYAILADFSVKRTIGGRRTRRVQRGGAFAPLTARTTIPQLETSIVKPFIYFKDVTIQHDSSTSEIRITLQLTESYQSVYFTLNQREINTTTEVLGNVINRGSSQKFPQCKINITREQTGSDIKYIVSINDVPLLEFEKDQVDKWFFSDLLYQKNNGKTDVIELKREARLTQRIIKKIKELVFGEDSTYGQPGQVGQLGQPGQVGQAPRVALAGSFFPQGPANIKGVLRNIKDKKKGKPIALAIARALILLKQIDPANSQGTPTTQVCATRYSFEGTEAIVPRKGIALDKTFYFKSWINLYNDIGEYRGGKYEWTQSMDGKRELDDAAKDLSVLYSNPSVQSQPDPTFLSKPLPEFIRVCPNKYDRDYMLSPQVMPQIQGVVKELLQLQDAYVKKANAILAKVFTFKADGSVSFRPEVMGGQGFQYISAVCVETRHTLFEYYMKVESLFMKGVIFYEKALSNNQLRQL